MRVLTQSEGKEKSPPSSPQSIPDQSLPAPGISAGGILIATDEGVVIDTITPYIIHAITTLSWKNANILGSTKLKINKGIREWMDHDTGFKNWVNTSLTNFIQTGSLDRWQVPIPDQWLDDLGVEHIYFERIEKADSSEIHVMV